jgi:hypothetical protein
VVFIGFAELPGGTAEGVPTGGVEEPGGLAEGVPTTLDGVAGAALVLPLEGIFAPVVDIGLAPLTGMLDAGVPVPLPLSVPHATNAMLTLTPKNECNLRMISPT